MAAATLLAAFTAATPAPPAAGAPAAPHVEIVAPAVATAPAQPSWHRTAQRVEGPRAAASEPVAALSRALVRQGAVPALPLLAPVAARSATARHRGEGAPIGVVFALPWLVLLGRRRLG